MNFCRYGTDVIFDNPTDTDSESLTANLHDKLRTIAVYRYAECRLHYAVFSYSHWLLVSRHSPVVAEEPLSIQLNIYVNEDLTSLVDTKK